ncbi:MAG: hypothetical protein AAGC95_09905 [Pseudomonadota bacterium]
MGRKTQRFGGEEVREESSWSYPLGILAATLILSAIFLYYYFGPRLEDIAGDTPKPTISEEEVSIVINNEAFQIPANYTVFPRSRRGGPRGSVFLYALWPNMSAYSPARRDIFVENDPRAPRIDILIEGRTQLFNEAERLEKLYLPLTIDGRGVPTPFELQRYTFRESRPDSPMNGYRDEELFIGRDENGAPIVLRCFKELPHIDSPDCRREYELGGNISITYRFKRPYMEEWRTIDIAVRGFVEQLHQGAG